ncbi:fluoride efflux transporter FluC [Stackebrandtia soli]|uniref:fluoride efflux transporter FluC n=1 Tax=Stackebrandtia soli TaxID=1892856 RepID=UPI0039EC2759
MSVLAVAAGAAVGAPLRYLLDRAVTRRTGAIMPWGTLVVNVLGCLVIGVLLGLNMTGNWYALLVIGLCGAFTTYSTFAYETLRLYTEGARPAAFVNVALQLACGLTATGVGWSIGAG